MPIRNTTELKEKIIEAKELLAQNLVQECLDLLVQIVDFLKICYNKMLETKLDDIQYIELVLTRLRAELIRVKEAFKKRWIKFRRYNIYMKQIIAETLQLIQTQIEVLTSIYGGVFSIEHFIVERSIIIANELNNKVEEFRRRLLWRRILLGFLLYKK